MRGHDVFPGFRFMNEPIGARATMVGKIGDCRRKPTDGQSLR